MLYCFLKKALGGALLSTSIWMRNGLSSGKNLYQVFLLEQSLIECTRELLSAGLLNNPISWAASNHKMSEALSSQKTKWSSSLPLLPPQVLPSTKSHQQNITHAWTLLLPIHPNISQNWTLQKFS